MKILHIIESLPIGGAEQVLINLVPKLCDRGLNCEVAALWSPYTLASKLESQNIQVHRLNIPSRWSLIEANFKLNKLLRKKQYDIIHAHLFFSEFYTALTYPLFPSARRVVSFHNLAYASYPANTLWKKNRKQMHSFLIRNCIDAQIGVSTAVAEHYAAHLKLKNVNVIHNGFPIDELYPSATLNKKEIQARYNIHSHEFVIIVPGRLVPEKDHAVLLQTIKILKQKNLCPKVLIFGEGPLKDWLYQKILKEQLLEQVIVHKPIPHQELMRVVQAADIFVLPSIYEGFGLAHAEAMAMAKPVIATRVGGLTDLIENDVSGILVPPKDADSLANAIAQLMKDDYKREQLGQAARKRIETCFSANVIADHYVNFYNKILTNQQK
ncbi:glycosyltransferase family 4 protein [Candidatus Marithrix sp. Canyon 246]|uniref:glycosyltransferase family 4 protein n=1 Tax=Candidatus Marithrix sp. Canyon 246 TaxID=1827136 RepID=UPI00084A04B2|nr:glycosyltransferase family 4 protein [Candidatus Marithrix sp. Canyon 246]